PRLRPHEAQGDRAKGRDGQQRTGERHGDGRVDTLRPQCMQDQVVGDFVIIPRVTIKSDEPIFIDGMAYSELKQQFSTPVFDLDTDGLIKLLRH
ncbi:MAG TPA: hypothetical protein PLP07_05000, partial [Pyrinomonadaceae bacterium]|nr:hypothetical protein [Pyrinomonadaceae bacterium]